ncbi:MAG: HupE/UreJ family protein [Paracoccaceae bacterium]
MVFPLSRWVLMLMRAVLLSTAFAINFAAMGHAHEIRPAIADVSLSADSIEMEIRLTAEPLVAGMDLDGLQDTNEAPEAEAYDQLRALSPDELTVRFEAVWPELRGTFVVRTGETDVLLDLDRVRVEAQEDLELPRDTLVSLSAALPEGDDAVRVGWAAGNGPLIVRQAGAGDDAYAGYLEGGVLSEPLPRAGAITESSLSVFVRYIFVGFDHIIPKGVDHILFVLGLFFLSVQMRPLLIQVTAFTAAHTITLAMASLGLVTVSPAIVEPLIAASIVYVAVENIFFRRITPWRPVVIFLFGLLHGLGFASVLGEFGLAPGRFIAGLIGFNVGVEVGQLAVILAAFLLVGFWFGRKPWYRAAIAIPGSVVIALIGGYWAIERTFL